MAPLLGQRDRNIEVHLEWIERARAQGSDLIVFPELSLTGYFLRDMVPELAMAADAPPLCELAKAAGDAAVVVGFVEESAGHRFYNAACYVQGGRVQHVHRKVYLPTYGLFDEGRYFARGERVRAFDASPVRAGLRRIGLLVCEDFWHLSAVSIMQAEGVDLLICIANSPARGVAGPNVATSDTYDRLCRTYAEMLGAVVIFVNRVGFEDGLCFWGGSRVVGPDARTIAQAAAFDETLVMATIDPEELRRQRLIAPLARDERLLLTIEELKRIKRARYEP
jgi:predicted amidohydrolase